MEAENNGLIYILKDKNNKYYIGKTINIIRRIEEHIKNIKNEGNCSSRELDIDFIYEILENNIQNDLLELKEQFWYDRYKEEYGDLLVNKCRPLNTIKEWKTQHKPELKIKNKNYREQNKDKIKNEKNEKCICDCGGKYTKSHKALHLKSKKHKKHTSTPPLIN